MVRWVASDRSFIELFLVPSSVVCGFFGVFFYKISFGYVGIGYTVLRKCRSYSMATIDLKQIANQEVVIPLSDNVPHLDFSSKGMGPLILPNHITKVNIKSDVAPPSNIWWVCLNLQLIWACK